MFNNIYSWLEQITNDIRSFVMNNFENPFMWLSFVIIALILFFFIYSILNNKK